MDKKHPPTQFTCMAKFGKEKDWTVMHLDSMAKLETFLKTVLAPPETPVHKTVANKKALAKETAEILKDRKGSIFMHGMQLDRLYWVADKMFHKAKTYQQDGYQNANTIIMPDTVMAIPGSIKNFRKLISEDEKWHCDNSAVITLKKGQRRVFLSSEPEATFASFFERFFKIPDGIPEDVKKNIISLKVTQHDEDAVMLAFSLHD